MNLVIVESPSKAGTIKKYLGKGYEVKASKGHVVDLPKSQIGIDVQKDFKPEYVVTNPKSIRELKLAYKNADKLILAADLDREGEAIAWHVAQKLGAINAAGKVKPGKSVERIVFNEISKSALEEALKHPRDINMDLVNAQQARRFLDRLVGYKLSPVLWKKITFGLSAGRVQSAALRLIVEKEEERRKFNSEEYWSLELLGQDHKTQNVSIRYKEKADENPEKFDYSDSIPFALSKYKNKKIEIKNKEEIDKVINVVKDNNLVIADVTKTVSKRYPKPPFTTSTLQQSSVNVLGFSAKKTMQLAQKLYEKGLITYMRTDSLSMSAAALEETRKFIGKKFGQNYLPGTPNFYKTKSKGAQEAHECIRPVHIHNDDLAGLDGDHYKLYNLIKNRTLASQMVPAQVETMSVVTIVNDYEFRATGTRIVFDGYLKVYPEKNNEVILPAINKGDVYYQKEILAEQHFTQPPARYSEATLVKKLEELGIGRPSTYASIISTIIARKYVVKEGKYLMPTDTGEVVNRLLVKYFNNIVDYGFTSGMEDNLDKIAEGKLDWLKMLKDFYFPFEKEVAENDKNISRDEFTNLGKAPAEIKCPECGSEMNIKLGRFGRFYSCSKYPECKGILSMDGETKEQVAKEIESDEFKSTYKSSPKTEDGRDYVLKKGKFGKFWAHPDYPKVKDIKSLEYTAEKQLEIFGEAPKTDKNKAFILRSGKYGYFWAHPDYPKVKEIVRIPKGKVKE